MERMDNNGYNNVHTNAPTTPVVPVSVQQAYAGQAAPQQGAKQEPQLEEPMSMGEWLVTLLLLCIPCANIVLMFVWAFSKEGKRSKSNFFKAYLIFFAIIVVIELFLFAIFGAAAVAAMVALS